MHKLFNFERTTKETGFKLSKVDDTQNHHATSVWNFLTLRD
jgi:hypothetical protein